MKKFAKRFLCVALCVVICLGVLAACSGEPEMNETPEELAELFKDAGYIAWVIIDREEIQLSVDSLLIDAENIFALIKVSPSNGGKVGTFIYFDNVTVAKETEEDLSERYTGELNTLIFGENFIERIGCTVYIGPQTTWDVYTANTSNETTTSFGLDMKTILLVAVITLLLIGALVGCGIITTVIIALIVIVIIIKKSKAKRLATKNDIVLEAPTEAPVEEADTEETAE